MSPAILELNDQSLLIKSADGELYSEPGYASLTDEGVDTGESARASAWREPQHSYNQYWSLLNQTPLVAKQRWARHHADIAFAQLKHLWNEAGEPESLVLLVPGCYSDSQLSLLLGLVAALPCQLLAVVDGALSACLQANEDTLYVDTQLHQTVVSLCTIQDQSIRIAEQEIFSDFGKIHIHNSIARFISRLLVDSARYDPLHASDSEQLIFDRIPEWLTRVYWENEVSATVESDQGELPFILRNADIKNLLSERLLNINSFLARFPDRKIVLSHNSELLAGLSDSFSSATLATRSSAIDNFLSQQDSILGQVNGLSRVCVLNRPEINGTRSKRLRSLATHILYENQALPLNKPVSITVTDGKLRLSNRIDEDAELTFVLRDRLLKTLNIQPELEAHFPDQCLPGESIQIADHQIKLIEVQDG